jgi:ABC-type branched-subunit amino acid transport system ATPase component
MSTVLAGHGLVKKYGNTTALAGVDVEVGERDSLAIMGPSGSGTVIPLVVLAGGATASGVYGAMKLNEAGGTTIDTSGALQLAACGLVGAAAVFAAIGAGRPLLRAVTDNPAPQPD